MKSNTLNPGQGDAIERVMRERYDAELTVWEMIRCSYEDAAELLAKFKLNYGYAGISDEDLARFLRLQARTELTAPNCFCAAIARRFLKKSPLEFALRLSISARYEWISSQCSHGYNLDELFRPALHAAAAHDRGLLARLAESAPVEIKAPNNRDYALILDAIIALLRNDDALLHRATAAAAKRKPHAYVRSVQQALIAIGEDSPQGFNEAMAKMLKNYPTYVWNDDVYRLVDPHAHGLFELCLQYRPGVATGFDTDRGLPWDSEYSQWLRTTADLSAHFEPESVPEDIRSALIDLGPLPWAEAFRQSVKKNMANPPDVRRILKSRH